MLWRIFRFIASAALIILALTCWPQPYFPFTHDNGRGIVVHSDYPMSDHIEAVLADVERRIATSQLPSAAPYHVYLCNEAWKLAVFGHKLSTDFGGITDVYLSRRIFIRPADIRANAIVPPQSWRFPLTDRPLSYFIAHEITHVQQVSALGRIGYARAPAWLLEGYADHVGKAGDFDLYQNLDLLRQGRDEMNPSLGLYRRYQLAVDLALKDRSFEELIASPPDPEAVLQAAVSKP